MAVKVLICTAVKIAPYLSAKNSPTKLHKNQTDDLDRHRELLRDGRGLNIRRSFLYFVTSG
jgi:hypothetical protein